MKPDPCITFFFLSGMTSMRTVELCVQIGTMELAHSKDNKMDRERHKSPDRKE